QSVTDRQGPAPARPGIGCGRGAPRRGDRGRRGGQCVRGGGRSGRHRGRRAHLAAAGRGTGSGTGHHGAARARPVGGRIAMAVTTYELPASYAPGEWNAQVTSNGTAMLHPNLSHEKAQDIWLPLLDGGGLSEIGRSSCKTNS